MKFNDAFAPPPEDTTTNHKGAIRIPRPASSSRTIPVKPIPLKIEPYKDADLMSLDFVELIIKHMIRDSVCLKKAKEFNVNADLFGDPVIGDRIYREFTNIALEVNDSPISKEIFMAHIRSKVAQGKLKSLNDDDIQEFIENIYNGEINSDYVARNIPEFVKRKRTLLLQLDCKDNVDDFVREYGKLVAELGQSTGGLPPIRKLTDYVSAPPTVPSELIEGILHQGSKLVLGGGSKSYKTWSLIDLGLSVAAGVSWWSFLTMKKKVLYLNFEVQESFFWNRINTICLKKPIALPVDTFHFWGLRGYAANIDKLLPEILARVKEEGYGLIILDPIYKLMGGRDENAAGDIASLMNGLEKIAVETGAGIVFGAHYSKGNQASKDAIDRIGGSGVYGRDPDSILTLTIHEEENCFTVDSILRNFAPQKPFVVEWRFPLMIRKPNLDPSKLKQAGGTPQLYTPNDLLTYLDGEMDFPDWKKEVMKQTGMKESTFYSKKKVLVEKGAVTQNPVNKKWSKRTV